MEIITEHLIEIIFGLISAGALGFCKHLWSKNKELEKLQKADQNRQYREMILNEIEPIQEELTRLHNEINSVDNDFKKDIDEVKNNAKREHKHMYDDLNKVQKENEKNFNLIINSYKFRLIQLCKTHLKDNYITNSDFEQITEMYKLYHGLGGNGQAQEYYERVLALEMKPD